MTEFEDKARRAISRIAHSMKALRPAFGREGGVPPRSSGARWADQQGDIFQPSEDPDKPQVREVSQNRPFVTQFYFWGTLALLTAGIAIAVILVRLPFSGDNDQDKAVYTDPLMSLDGAARDQLLKPSPELAARLKRSFLGKPDALCAELHGLGLENPGWRKAPFKRGRWQCASDLVSITTPSVDYGATTLFFLLRGPSETKIDYLRLKLVVEDERQKQLGLNAVWLVIDALAGRYGWTVPEEFREAITDFTELETVHRGVQLSVTPEDPNLTGDPLARLRLNIIMNFGEPDLIRPADSFEQAPPLESGWSITDQDGQAGE